MIKKVFSPLIDFFRNLFSGNFKEAFSNAVDFGKNFIELNFGTKYFKDLGEGVGEAYGEGWKQGAGGLYTQVSVMNMPLKGGIEGMLGLRQNSWDLLANNTYSPKNNNSKTI